MADYDLAIIGGGVNGTGIARDAAGRGFRVLLVEMNDLASGTSSAATKLVHGGLRYLEHYEFRLVREALAEREVLCAWRRTSSGRCASCCRARRGRGRPGCCGSGCSSTTISAAASSCRRPTLDLTTPRGGRAAQARASARLRVFRLLGRRRAAGRAQRASTRPIAARSIRTRTRLTRAEREEEWRLDPQRATARREAVNRARAGQRRRAVGRQRAPRRAAHRRPAARAAGQGQPHRGAQAVRSRPRLLLPERPTGGIVFAHPLRAATSR